MIYWKTDALWFDLSTVILYKKKKEISFLFQNITPQKFTFIIQNFMHSISFFLLVSRQTKYLALLLIYAIQYVVLIGVKFNLVDFMYLIATHKYCFEKRK